MRAAFLYARVSTDEQADKNLSIPFQVEAIEKYAAAHGYEIVDRFTDDGYSGETMDRPGMNRLVKQVTKQRPAAVLYLDEDRWSRGYD
ncbi:MAG TPA: recombinase family protein, partial [Candidatus Limnocylindria bacterium]|nr:recombinase family protein [Candidatus Limnocylindria bacterium]